MFFELYQCVFLIRLLLNNYNISDFEILLDIIITSDKLDDDINQYDNFFNNINLKEFKSIINIDHHTKPTDCINANLSIIDENISEQISILYFITSKKIFQ